MSAEPTSSEAINLAREPDFRLGGLLVRPSACRVSAAGRERRVEPRVMEVLVRLYRSRNQTVTRDELIESCWGGRFISDDAVSRVIHAVRGLAQGLEPAPFVLETLPKVGFRFIVADDDAPAAETPEAPAARGRRRLLAAALIGLAAMLAAGVAWRLAATDGGQNGRVEVVRFRALQQDAALDRYSLALADAAARLLTTSGVKTSQLVPEAGARPTDAEFRVAGTVDREGDRYVVNAQILERRSGEILWSARLDRPADRPIDFHEEAAARIADVLDCALWHRSAGREPVSSAVFSLFLNACMARRVDPRSFMEVTTRLAQAAPDHSYAQSFHAVATALTASLGDTSPANAQGLGRTVEAASRRALELDRRNGEAHLALGVRYGGWGRWHERERHFQKAAELSPTLRVVRDAYVPLLRDVGRWDEAEAMNRRTVADDPFSRAQLTMLGIMRGADGDLAEAEAMARRLDRIDHESARQLRYTLTLFWKAPQQALAELPAYAEDGGHRSLACHQAYLTRLIEARGAPLKGMPPACEGLGDFRVRMLAREGDVDGAYATLEAAPANYRFPGVFFYPEMKAFRRDPRFMPLAKRVGLVDYWMKSGHWPDFCAEPDLPYDCKAAAKALS